MKRSNHHSSKYRGKITSLYQDYEDENVVRLEIEPAGQPKPKTKKGEVAPHPRTRSENVSKTMAKGLAIGSEVEVVTIVRQV